MTREEPRRDAARTASRSEDRALLARLEAEIALETALEGTGIEGLPRRAAGSVELLGAEGAAREVADAVRGDGRALARLLLIEPTRRWSPALRHHLAVLADHALEAALEAPAQLPRVLTVRDALTRAIDAWLVLADDLEPLRRAARLAADGSVAPARLEALIGPLPLRGIDHAERLAREGLKARTEEGHAAVVALRDTLAGLASRGLETHLEERVRARVIGTLDGLAMDWLVRFRDAADELLAREWSASDARALFTDAARAWEWLAKEPEIERQILTTLPDFAWPVYRRREMTALGAMLEPIMPLAWSLEGRVHDDRRLGAVERELAYVAPCAQALVFWAEIPREVEQALPRIERAFALSPTLRNARVVLAHVLCDRAEHTLARRELFPAHAPRDDVARAAEIFPELSRLPSLKRRVGLAP